MCDSKVYVSAGKQFGYRFAFDALGVSDEFSSEVRPPLVPLAESNFSLTTLAFSLYPPDHNGFHFVTLTPPPTPLTQCVERFHHNHSNEKNIIARLLKYAGYIHNHKILPGDIFGLMLKK